KSHRKQQTSEIINKQCYAAGKNLSVMPNGDVFTCFQQELIPGCQKAIGSLKNDNLDELIRSDYIMKILEKMQECDLPCKVLKCNQME
ncbi:MAG: SPASM domain-containing protein, partial [bacterium]